VQPSPASTHATGQTGQSHWAPPPQFSCHTCEAFHSGANGLNPGRCDSLMRQHGGKMWKMFAYGGWSFRREGESGCLSQPGFFEDLLSGRICGRNWYDGVTSIPDYPRPAPALLGFDETIYAFCSAETGKNEGPFYQDNYGLAHRCIKANENVLRTMNGWNICVNFQWQTCAALGKLPGQGNREIHFSIAPKDLDVGLFEHPTSLVGDYAISDVYFLEICTYSHVCRNRNVLFSLGIGEIFVCDFDEAAFYEFRSLMNA